MVYCLYPPAFLRLKFAHTLKEAGVPLAQEEAQAMALSEVLEVNLKELVTKEDLHREIESLRQEMMTGFAQVDSRFIQLEQPLIIKLGGLMSLSIGIVASIPPGAEGL